MPVEPIIVSYSELDTFRQCPLKHFLAYEHRYKKPPKSDSALAKGSLYHLVMEDHYNYIKNVQATDKSTDIRKRELFHLDTIYDTLVKPRLFDPVKGGYVSEVHELIDWMYKGYVANYGMDLHWKILGVEHQIIVPLRDARGHRTRYHLKAKMDLVVADLEMGGMWVVDHKSGANLPTQMDMEIDDQFGLYQWAMGQVGRKVRGSVHSANRTTRNMADKPGYTGKAVPQSAEQRFARTVLSRSDIELKNLAFDAYQVARAAHPPASVPRAMYSSPDPRQCGWKCDFKEAHIAMRKGVPLKSAMKDFGFVIDKTRH